MNVEAWLTDLGLEQYVEAFAENDVDGDTLTKLTAEDLTDIGVKSVGHRRKLLGAINELHASGTEPATLAEPSSEPEAERRQVTVLFADLSGPTKLSRDLGSGPIKTLVRAEIS